MIVVALCAFASGSPSPVDASHSVPSPPWYWDLGNDGDADAAVPVDAAGSGWTSLALDRLHGAIDEWASGTDFDPYYVGSGSQKVYRDGTEPCEDGTGFEPEDFMVTCTYSTFRTTYWDISGSDTYAQTDAHLPSPMVRFWYGAAHSSSETDVDFQGTATHELGHWVLLGDLGPVLYGTSCNYGTGMYTMCGELTSNFDEESWRQRSLTSDDINAANAVY